MNEYYMFGLQRSGTNFLETLMSKNFNAKKQNMQNGSWKHSINVPPKYDESKSTIVIHKNPYTWVESIAYRNTVDWLKTQKEYPATQIDDEDMIIGNNPKINLVNMIKTYKHFHDTWLNEGHFQIRYEDLLTEETRADIITNISAKYGFELITEDLIIPESGTVSQSRDYNDERKTYYLNGIPRYLSTKHIEKIGDILGKEYIENMGYSVL